MANFQVSKEYVRGQLVSMGIQNISEEDLEAYTRGILIHPAIFLFIHVCCFIFQISLDWLKVTLSRMTLPPLLAARVRHLRRLALGSGTSQGHMEHRHHQLMSPHSIHLSIPPSLYSSLAQLYSRWVDF